MELPRSPVPVLGHRLEAAPGGLECLPQRCSVRRGDLLLPACRRRCEGSSVPARSYCRRGVWSCLDLLSLSLAIDSRRRVEAWSVYPKYCGFPVYHPHHLDLLLRVPCMLSSYFTSGPAVTAARRARLPVPHKPL
ncbi:hypothetical protein V5799_007428 [Amblyomma americanum]|uniref:Uncharacterized protein n=1 Tax=Amblyomma americanum TaxID=6943 RepID=A0AAQ4FHF8_AMBAM